MRNDRLVIFIALSITLFFCVAAQSNCQPKNKADANKTDNKSRNMNTEKQSNESVSNPAGSEIKIIAQGANSQVEDPFIFTIRSAETYAQLSNLIENLPPASAVDFGNTAIVAAFAGTKNTGGYSVNIVNSAGKIAIASAAPPPDAMVTQALTTPYAVAVVPVDKDEALPLELSGEWSKAAENYKITSGEFESSGGITGRAQKFTAEGTIKILRFGDYATLVFDLSGAEKARALNSVASGTIKEGKIELARVDAGTFAQTPRPPLKVSGTIAADKLTLNFDPRPAVGVSDSFQVHGKIEAAKAN